MPYQKSMILKITPVTGSKQIKKDLIGPHGLNANPLKLAIFRGVFVAIEIVLMLEFNTNFSNFTVKLLIGFDVML